MGDTTKFHPLTGAPIVPLGFRKNGQAIWPIMGASEPAPEGDPTPAPTPPDPPADAPKPDVTPDDDKGKGGKDALLGDLAKERDKRQGLEREIQSIKDAQQAQMDSLAKAFGLKKDDEPVDPETLTADVTAAQADAREARLHLAVFQAAPKHEANANALLDSASFLRAIKDIDPTDADAVAGAIKTAIEADTKFKAAQPAPVAPSFGGGPRTPAPTRTGSLGGAISQHYAS